MSGETEALELATACREAAPGKRDRWAWTGGANVEPPRGIEHDARRTPAAKGVTGSSRGGFKSI
jgi:hypothetical protein